MVPGAKQRHLGHDRVLALPQVHARLVHARHLRRVCRVLAGYLDHWPRLQSDASRGAWHVMAMREPGTSRRRREGLWQRLVLQHARHLQDPGKHVRKALRDCTSAFLWTRLAFAQGYRVMSLPGTQFCSTYGST